MLSVYHGVKGTGKSFTAKKKKMVCLYLCLLTALSEGLFSQERILTRPLETHIGTFAWKCVGLFLWELQIKV
jgi:hypothetical protein